MKNIFLCLISFFVFNLKAISQDGKIIDQTSYSIADSSLKKFQRVAPDISTIINSVDFFSITYLSDGLKVKGYFAVPKKQGTYPAIIYNRGGNRESGALNDGQIIRMLGIVSSWGYVCIASQYRGNGGGEGKEEFGGKEVNDILNLIPCLEQIPKADTSLIGMFGWSRGGMMTYLALTKTCRIKAAVVGSGIANALVNTAKRPEMDSVFSQLVPGYFANRDSALKSRSAVYWAERICKTTPLFLLAGSADWRVSPDEALEMVNVLYKIKHPLRFEFLEGGQHSLIEHFDEVNRSIKLFLDAYVRDKKEWPTLNPHGN
ncbi:prolyl oligopeptidase family serine peptidase [soil metagenome]